MARLAARVTENVDGEFFVDESCIDCDACRQIAPETFAESARFGQSYVWHQPATDGETRRAAMALVACPTSSIGSLHKIGVGEASRAFPERVDGEVYYCGYHSPHSYGASSYLVRREKGNVLVDSPRAARPLLARIEEMGGVARLFLSHRDDVADHAELHKRFGCTRILHRADRSSGTAAIEQFLDGKEPIELDEDLIAIPVPGHTRGSVALLYAETFLFTGDHLWWSDERKMLHASRGVCWYSWEEQVASVEKLLDFRFEWVLPGHGRRHHAKSAAAMRGEIEKTVAALKSYRR